MAHRVVLIQGGGIGTDQEACVRRLVTAAGVEIDWVEHAAGRAAVERGRPPIPPELVAAVRQAGAALRTKLLPVPGGDGANYNVTLRRELGLFASVRPVRNLAGVPARFDGIDFTLVREITEDLYNANEHEIVPGVVQSLKIVTEAACLRFFRFAFGLARREGRKSIHCIHKANILKQADGLFLDCFRRVAKDFPDVEPKDMIVDNGCMQLVSRPRQFEMIAAGNLYGDLLSDLGAGLVGGISATAGVNHGDGVRVYEAIFGATAEALGGDRANPLPLIMPALQLLGDLGEADAAARIRAAVESTLQGGIKTADLGGTARTSEFTDAVLSRMG